MPQTAAHRMGALEWTLLILLSQLWGGSFFFGIVALAELGPLTIVMCRVILGTLALNLIARLTGHRLPKDLRTWGLFLVLGAINNAIPFTLIFWAETQIPSGLASVLNATSPLFTVVLAHILTHDERLTANRLRGVLLGLAAVVVIVGPSVLRDVGANVWAQLAVIGASISYAFASIFAKRFRDTPPLLIATCQVTCSAVIMTPMALLIERPWLAATPGASTIGALLFLGLLSTALAYVIYFRLIAMAGATNAILVTLMVPLSAVLLGAVFLHEPVLLRQVLGMLLLAAGLLITDGRLGAMVRQARGYRPENATPSEGE